MSEKLIRKQLTLFGHLIRAPEPYYMKLCSVLPTGERVNNNFKRVGRPRMKWYDGVRRSVIAKLVRLQVLPATHLLIMRPSEITLIILEAAQERLL
eukprot:16441620-Heterocapsa_arctica.AAC.1